MWLSQICIFHLSPLLHMSITPSGLGDIWHPWLFILQNLAFNVNHPLGKDLWFCVMVLHASSSDPYEHQDALASLQSPYLHSCMSTVVQMFCRLGWHESLVFRGCDTDFHVCSLSDADFNCHVLSITEYHCCSPPDADYHCHSISLISNIIGSKLRRSLFVLHMPEFRPYRYCIRKSLF